MGDYDFSKLIPRCFRVKRKRRVRQKQAVGRGSTSVQAGGNIRINGKEVYIDDEEEFGSKWTAGQICNIVGFALLTVCATALEASGGDGGGLWIVVVLWAFKLGDI